jgi:hypothetical protein
MKIFSIAKYDDEWRKINYPLDRCRLEPRGVSPNQSDVTTIPWDRDTLNHINYKYFKYIN